jgi:ABC-type Fe3+/spermidine/putrescine transport system ATPase subunit
VTVVIRPENTSLVDPGSAVAHFDGAIETTLYTGADTQFQVRLADGTQVMARAHNRRDDPGTPEPGAAVGIAFREGSAQVLRT